ncbi:hypothetical protein [Crocosphaera chwakensis]|uniref:Uncharacterized protein n=1 Tax=Crocosphaera chwakensis CCY0110 TaxID=391612 RepID=A3IUK0_9CHRO|nr:hypothetical protein [Crocosphaera chwakensis]EAZ89887.1 hypothetical protein CY0110_06364 [Crocosphaera chwakensis CCY0110]
MYKIFGLIFSHLNPNKTKNNPQLLVFLTNNLFQRWLKVGIVTVILLCSLAIYPIQLAHAVNSSHSETGQNNTVNQTRNSVGTENLPGGVESAILKDGKNTPQPKKSSKSKMKQLRDQLSETSPNTAPIDKKNQKN